MAKGVAVESTPGGSAPGPPGPPGPPPVAPGGFTIGAASGAWISWRNVRLTIPVTPPGTMGTTQGGHIYVEAPDQSAAPTGRMDGVTLMDGSTVMQADWNPEDLGKFPFAATESAWVLDLYTADLDPSVSNDLRVYVSSYSDQIDTPLVRHGLVGATPSVVVTVPAQEQGKPNSAASVTPLLVTAVSASVGAAVSVGGKLRRPISVTVNLSGLPTYRPVDWEYQLLGYVNGDITTPPILASGYLTDTGLIQAGPDGISTDHTFAPEEPTAATSITIFAVAGLAGGSRVPSGGGYGGGRTSSRTSTGFTLNNIVPGITASCVVSIGTTSGTVDPTKFVAANLSGVFGNVGTLFDIVPLAIDNSRQGTAAIASINLQALAVTNPKLAALAVQAANLAASSVGAGNMLPNSITAGNAAIAAAAIGTAAIQNAAITNALMANLSVGSAQIQNLAVQNAHIQSVDVSKLNAGTITVAVSLTAPTITVTSGGTTINIDSTNFIKVSKSGFVQQLGTGLSSGFGSVDGLLLTAAGGGIQSYISAGGLTVGTPSGTSLGYSTVDAGGHRVYNGANRTEILSSGVFIDGNAVVKARSGISPTTLANVISVLQYHGLCS